MKQDPSTIVDIEQDPGLHRNPLVQKITKPLITIPKYHWTRDKVDKRDYLYAPTVVKLSTYVDLRPYCSSIEDQGRLGSCTGNAIAGAIELLMKRNNKFADISRLFIYYYERLLENTVNYDSGAYIRDGIKACYTYGAATENLWPYDISKFRNRPSIDAVNDAKKRKVKLYERVSDFNGVINAIDNGYPVTIGFDVYSSFDSPAVARTGIMPYPNIKKEKLLGGHAVLIVGYNKNNDTFIVRNSWGKYWGDNGYFYMPFQVIKNNTMSGDFWVIKSIST
jgi:C1A family cysteine protease